jgi:hypothetical protein
MIATLFFVSYASYLYFNTELAINAHAKSIDQLAYVFIAVFFLYETRISLKRQSWRFYVAFGYVAALMCAYSSIPSLIVYFVNGKCLSDSIYESIMTFSALIFIVVRLLQTAFLRNNECCHVALSVIAASRERAKGIEEHDGDLMKIIEESEASRLEDKRMAGIAELHELVAMEEQNEEKIEDNAEEAEETEEVEAPRLIEEALTDEVIDTVAEDEGTDTAEDGE